MIDFVNTLDVETGADELAGIGGLEAWFSQHGEPKPTEERPRERDRRRAVDVREALRSLMLAHNGGAPDERAGAALERAARDGGLSVHFNESGDTGLAADGSGFDRQLAALLIPVVAAAADGSWQRVKACRASDCNWAFYDRSRNRSGVWCEMAVCGNRTKVRAFRERGR